MKDCRTVKTVRKLAMAVACVAYAACADEAPAVNPVVYTVTTSRANTTNLLSEATVEIDDNGTVTQAAFPDVSLAPNSIFRKRGEGFLKSCSGMGSFTGEVRIEEGALVINAPGQLGPSVKGSGTDPLVAVSNGASLVIATAPDVEQNALCLCGGIRIAGSGYNGIGALRSECEARAKYLFSSDLTLDSDATIVNASAMAEENDAQWGTESGIDLNLNGFKLTVSGRRFWLNGGKIKPGHIAVASDGYIQLQSVITLAGTAENTIAVKSGGALELYSNAKIETPWTLVLEDGAQIHSRVYDSAGKIDNIYWNGPVTLNGRVLVHNNGKSYGLTLRGAVSGSGGFDLSNGQLDLIAENNSFAGGVSANAAGSNPLLLGLWSGTSLSSPFTATNSSLSLSSPAEYRLPPLSFHVPDGKVNCATGGIGGTAASLLKTGSGVLELTAPLAVTGGVTLAGGVLRLSSDISPYSPAPGLIESRYEVPDKTVGAELMDEWYTTGSSMNTNRVVMMPEMAEQQYDLDGYTWIRTGCEFVRYKGYIWNRADHDVTWTFAVAICPQSVLYIGKDENIPESPTIKRTTSNNADTGWKNMGLATMTLSPGPHYFDLRMYSQGYDKPGARGDAFENWPLNYGFAIDFEGRGTTDAANFSIPSNNVCGTIRGGDGALFTLDARTRDDVTGIDYTRASFPALGATAGTTLDLNAPGYTFTVQELSGITAVANGNLHVASRWTLSNETLDSGVPLSGEGKLTFGPEWTLSVPDLGTLGLPNRRTIAVADEGGLTLPAVFDRGEDPDFAWRLELSADGKQLQLVRSRFVISIR